MARVNQVPGLDSSAYERMPKIGENLLRFEPKRYIPPRVCINVDDHVRFSMNRHVRTANAKEHCFRCGASRKNHPKRCNCGWCGGAAEHGHPDRECPWIYATANFWKKTIQMYISVADRKDTPYLPVGVQIRPTREEQTVLAQTDHRFTSFPHAQKDTDEIVVPAGVTLRYIPDRWKVTSEKPKPEPRPNPPKNQVSDLKSEVAYLRAERGRYQNEARELRAGRSTHLRYPDPYDNQYDHFGSKAPMPRRRYEMDSDQSFDRGYRRGANVPEPPYGYDRGGAPTGSYAYDTSPDRPSNVGLQCDRSLAGRYGGRSATHEGRRLATYNSGYVANHDGGYPVGHYSDNTHKSMQGYNSGPGKFDTTPRISFGSDPQSGGFQGRAYEPARSSENLRWNMGLADEDQAPKDVFIKQDEDAEETPPVVVANNQLEDARKQLDKATKLLQELEKARMKETSDEFRRGPGRGGG
ncbi:hypothetical protein Ptr902_05988 [Pyrenophora tritici-repentis]|uniref:Uncharacterized protein n=1 Tax=Pyrenophora tritici-repentis TaxID=45151 RepID=A0A2W1CMN5_9PLEO|nr:hypothetical protein PtrM4_072760 [Pyrenophora tritici-repentis]KAI0569802.1 hypothetical protein Alg215_11427 [Pyrenophora tritici-repentis]KAI1561395.1 hypothetical protein PtrEW7m1_011251 [Pyrenophora tritici-repentis]KAI2483671.1 hypothetical protein Ptr902_05988 [Pyrenophora tritici-repentis]PZC88932.1 hypothetical protein A1F95_10639 [Pyrenophora tritici-repentis]